MGDELSSNGFSDQTGEIGGNDFHSSLEVLLDFTTELEHSQGPFAKFLKAFDIKITDLLSHGGSHSFSDPLSQLSVSNNLLNLLETGSAVSSISNEGDELDEDVVIGYNSCELGEMPRVPLFDSHREGVDILIKKLEEVDRLDDGLVLPVYIERNLVAGEGVGET